MPFSSLGARDSSQSTAISGEVSAAFGTFVLLEMSLAAIPLLVEAQCAVTGQVNTAMGATDHWRRFPFGRGLGGGGLPLEFAPEPYCSGNQGNPEQ
ncbi:hypothetical protein D3C86_1764870 [compost metagenome]